MNYVINWQGQIQGEEGHYLVVYFSVFFKSQLNLLVVVYDGGLARREHSALPASMFGSTSLIP